MNNTMNLFTKRALLIGFVALCGPLATWAFFIRDDEPQNVTVLSSHDFDELNRLKEVTRGNGHSVSYSYDPAGNILGVTATGRSSAKLQGVLGKRDDDDHDGRDDFKFVGVAGEPITVRLEAIPREAGVGKFARIRLRNKTVLSALPTELTMVLPESGKFEVRVLDHEDDDRGSEAYSGPFTITLEAAAATCASFVADSDDDDH